jgi:predicted dehydrogenase
LSHELDYVSWLFGEVEIIDSISTKVSDLEINTDDLFTAIGLTKSKTIINMSMDYISKTPMRKMVIHTNSSTIKADLIKNSIVEFKMDAEVKVVDFEAVDRNQAYVKMHQSVLSNEFEQLCSFDEGNAVVDIITNIKYKEL